MPDKEYIEREAVNNVLDELMVNDSLYNALQDIPAADVVSIVRCKDCIYYNATHEACNCGKKETNGVGVFFPNADDFCSYGERK